MDYKDLVEFIENRYPGLYKRILENYEKYGNGSNDVEQQEGDNNVPPICLGAVFEDIRSKAAFMMELFSYRDDENGERSSKYKPLDCINGITFALNALNNDLEALAKLHTLDD